MRLNLVALLSAILLAPVQAQLPCTPGTYECGGDGIEILVCNPQGNAWLVSAACGARGNSTDDCVTAFFHLINEKAAVML